MRALHLAAAAAALQLMLAQSAAADDRHQDIDALVDALVLEAAPPAADTDGDDGGNDPDKEYVCIDDDLTDCEELGDMIARCVMIPDPAACGALDPGETWQFGATHAVSQAQMNDGSDLDNLASVTTSEGVSGSDNAVTEITVNRSVAIDKTANLVKAPGNTAPEAEAGDTIDYTYDVTNDGNQTFSPIIVTDVHSGAGPFNQPAGETLVADVLPLGDSTDATTNDGNWTTLQPGDTIRFTASYTVVQEDIDLN